MSKRGWIALMLTCLLSAPLAAQDDDMSESSVYFDLAPDFVANYGNNSRAAHFLRTSISLRVETADGGVNKVVLHQPAIRHEIVMIISRQTDASINSADGRERLRKELLEAVQRVLNLEEGSNSVIDLLFNTFLVQA